MPNHRICVIPYRRDMDIRNLDALAPGSGARFLEVIESHDGSHFIAAQWRRRKICEPGRILIEFPARPQTRQTPKG